MTSYPSWDQRKEQSGSVSLSLGFVTTQRVSRHGSQPFGQASSSDSAQLTSGSSSTTTGTAAISEVDLAEARTRSIPVSRVKRGRERGQNGTLQIVGKTRK